MAKSKSIFSLSTLLLCLTATFCPQRSSDFRGGLWFLGFVGSCDNARLKTGIGHILYWGLRRLCFPCNFVGSMFLHKTQDWGPSYLVSTPLSLLYFLSIHPILRVLCVLCVNSDSMPCNLQFGYSCMCVTQ